MSKPSMIFVALLLWANPAFAQEEAPEAPEAEAVEAPAEEAPAAEEEEAEAPSEEEVVVEVPADEAEAVEDAVEAVDALQKGKYATFGALIMGILVFLWNKFVTPVLRRKEEE